MRARSSASRKKVKPAREVISRGFSFNNPGGFLLSHAVARAVPSAPRGLTSVFGMGTGVTLSTQPPENLIKFQISNLRFEIMRKNFFGSGDLAFGVPAIYRSHRRADPESALRNLFEIPNFAI